MERIECLVKLAGQQPVRMWVENTLEALQAMVGGYIEPVSLPGSQAGDIVVICDEEGRIKGKPINCLIQGVDFCGDILICGAGDEEFADVPDYEAAEKLIVPIVTVEVVEA